MTNTEIAPPNSEEALAIEFAQLHADKLRYVAAWGKWFIWDGICWRSDETRKVFSMAREVCRENALTLLSVNAKRAMASAKTRAAVVSLASDARTLAATIDQWDADPWLLNTPGGVVDLRNGTLRPARPDDYMTKVTACSPDDSKCPGWDAFIKRVTNDDKTLAAYLMRVCGYLLTGLTREHALFFLYGLGGNGKGTFLNTVADILLDYSCAAPIETFTESKIDRHPTELAGLRGARMVTAIETEEGRRWAEARIKMLTGGDRVRARFMRQDFFDYVPQFKLIIAGNHKPGLRSVDEAIRRRFNLIPFIVTITKEECDPELPEKLKKERSGILARMVAGCTDWRNNGLKPPKVVTDATDKYLAEEDTFKIWLDECCRLQAGEWTSIGALYSCLEDWSNAHGEYAISSKRLSQKLEEAGFVKERRHGGRGFGGLTIYEHQQPDADAKQATRSRIWFG
jgi:putative DNA primase/helicase